MDENFITTNCATRLGANYNKSTQCVDFKLQSLNATAVILCIFENAKDFDSIMNLKMEHDLNDNIFKTSVKKYALFNLEKPFYYGYRVFGPNFEYSDNFTPGSKEGFKSIVDENGNRFNPNKLAYDPYTRELSHLHSDVSNQMEIFRSGSEFVFNDNAKLAPKSVFMLNDEIKIQKTSTRALKDEIIGEVHLKDLTQLSSIKEKGTYLGAAEFASNVKKMGVTMIEFLPLHEFDNKAEVGNYWGYMPLCYFAPVKNYAYDKKNGNTINEFRQMIKAFHDNDIKVCMDVVYNHTGEAKIYSKNKDDANLFSYALIDNANYYKSDKNGFYAINSGCHNDSNIADGIFQNLITDSLEYWIHQGVDAFRFDLATSLMDVDSSSSCHYDKNKGFVTELKIRLESRGINVLSPTEVGCGVNLIAEPWTCGGNDSYQLGNFPFYFAEWNDIAKNTIRANTMRLNDTDALGLRYLIEGVPHKFRGELRSVNYLASHDGFTLWDMNSYDKKNPNTLGGADWELSSSYNGNDKLRKSAIRKQIALLMISYGIVMLQIGDIVLHSKDGNNNSYNADSLINWINFEGLDESKEGLSSYIKEMINFRKNHKVLSDPDYIKKLEFFTSNGDDATSKDSSFWMGTMSNFLGVKINANSSIFVAISKNSEIIEVQLPNNAQGKKWHLVADTNVDEVSHQGIALDNDTYSLKAFSLAIFIEK